MWHRGRMEIGVSVGLSNNVWTVECRISVNTQGNALAVPRALAITWGRNKSPASLGRLGLVLFA